MRLRRIQAAAGMDPSVRDKGGEGLDGNINSSDAVISLSDYEQIIVIVA